MNIVTVNGEQYSRNPIDEKKYKPSKTIMAFAAMAGMFGGGLDIGYSKPRPYCDIVKEYELIQQKKSNLSKSDRDWVCRMFESNYTKIESYEIGNS